MKRTYRICRDLRLQLRNKTPKRRVKAKLRDDRQEAVGPNDVWAMDFVHDQHATGKKIPVLTVVDTFSRHVAVLDPRFSYRAEDVVRALQQVCPQAGYPKTSLATNLRRSSIRLHSAKAPLLSSQRARVVVHPDSETREGHRVRLARPRPMGLKKSGSFANEV